VDSERQRDEGVMCDCLQFSLVTSTLSLLLTMVHSSMGGRGTLNSWSVAKEAGQWPSTQTIRPLLPSELWLH